MIGRIIGSVLLTAFGLLMMLYVIGDAGSKPHTFVGHQEFATMKDMHAFQSDLVSKVKEAGGYVQSFDLVVLSPPKVTFMVYVPSTYEFEYGKQFMSLLATNIVQGVLLIVFMTVTILLNWRIWHVEHGSNMPEGK